jgi:hypothetical protein
VPRFTSGGIEHIVDIGNHDTAFDKAFVRPICQAILLFPTIVGDGHSFSSLSPLWFFPLQNLSALCVSALSFLCRRPQVPTVIFSHPLLQFC